MSFTWKTPMRKEGDRPLRGQVAVQPQDGGVYLIIMPAPGTFPADAVISVEDARALRDALTDLVDR